MQLVETVVKKSVVLCLIALLVFGTCQGALLLSRTMRGALIGLAAVFMVAVVARYRWRAARRLEDVPLILDNEG